MPENAARFIQDSDLVRAALRRVRACQRRAGPASTDTMERGRCCPFGQHPSMPRDLQVEPNPLGKLAAPPVQTQSTVGNLTRPGDVYIEDPTDGLAEPLDGCEQLDCAHGVV